MLKQVLGISIALIMTVYNFAGHCQDKKMGYGISLFPNFSKGYADVGDTNSSYYRGLETMSFSYSAGLVVDFYTKSLWGISLGVNFQKTGDRSTLFPWDANRGFPSRSYKHWHNYLELSLNAFRTFDKWALEFGISPQFSMSNTVKYYHEGVGDPFEMDISEKVNGNFGICGNLGFGYTFQKNDFVLKVIPYAQFHVVRPMNSYDFQINGLIFDYIPARNYANFGLRLSYLIAP